MQVQKTKAEEALGILLPTRKVESFHYTDLRAILRDLPEPAMRDDNAVGGSNHDNAGDLKYAPFAGTCFVRFLDGSMKTDFTRSAIGLPAGVSLSVINERPKTRDVNDTIAAINAAIEGEAVEIAIRGDATREKPLGLGHVSSQAARSSVYHKVTVKSGAEAWVCEHHASGEKLASLATEVTDLFVEAGATVNWFIIQQENNAGSRLARLNVTLEAGTNLSIFVLNAGGRLVRQEIRISVNGENANVSLRGVNLVGDGAHIDVTTLLEHNVANTNAQECFRNVVAGDGHGIFQGQIKVAQPAQKTDAQMACNTLLLTDEGAFSAKPELEIFADDVVCAHGATVTDIDDEHMFYLMARGISEKSARSLLIKAFVDEVVEEVGCGQIFEDAFIGIIDGWLDENS